MVSHFCDGRFHNRTDVFGNTGVCNHHIKLGDVVVGLQQSDCGLCIILQDAVDLDNYEFASLPNGKFVKKFVRDRRVSESGNDDNVRAKKELFQKSFAKTYQARSIDVSVQLKAALDSTRYVRTSASASNEVSCMFRHKRDG